MCYEFSSWHWKARAKELHKAQVKTKASEEEQKIAAAKPAQETERKRSEANETEKIPA